MAGERAGEAKDPSHASTFLREGCLWAAGTLSHHHARKGRQISQVVSAEPTGAARAANSSAHSPCP